MGPPDTKNGAAWSWLLSVLAPVRAVLPEILVFSLFVNLLAMAVPVFVMQVYDRVVFHAGLSTLQALLAGIGCVLVFDWVLRQARARILQRVAMQIDATVGRQLLDKLLSLPLRTLESRPSAHWHALFRDLDSVRGTLSGATALMPFDLLFALLFLGLIFVIAAPVFWVLMVILPVFLLVAWWSGRTVRITHGAERESHLQRDTLLSEIVAGRTTVKALGLDRAIRPLWEERHAECIERAVTRGARADGHANLGMTLTMAGTVAMTAAGALAIIEQQMTVGALIAANMLSGRLLGAFNQLVGNWRAYVACMQAAGRLAQTFASPSDRATATVRLQRPEGRLVLEDVTFAYAEGAAPALDHVSLAVAPGECCGLVGRNGSGKSTLLKLMQGLYRPAAGRVLLDGADLAQFSRSELAAWIGYVPQDCLLFAGSIRDNLAFARPDASDDDIVRAAKLAGLHPVVLDLPDGYATDVGEAGRRLSAGQRQRIAIARALMADPPVLLLDEPTSGLDEEAQQQLRALLPDWARQRTIVVVTHSLALLPVCRRLVRLERGRVAEMRGAEELMPHLLAGRLRQAAAE